MSTKNTTGRRRTAVLISTAAASLLAAAAVAQAHVTVNPGSAAQGSWAKVSFRVPNEEANASTTAVEVDLPTDTPIASVSVKPVPGWTATTTSSPLATPLKTDDGEVTSAVSKIVWTGGKIDPGQFQEFDVALGPLPVCPSPAKPGCDQVVFKTLQTYSDGSVVRWIDVPQAGQPEPDHPAPILKLTPAGADGGAAAPSAGQTNPTVALSAAGTDPKSSDGTARALGIAGLGVGVIGLGTAVVALRRKSTSSDSTTNP